MTRLTDGQMAISPDRRSELLRVMIFGEARNESVGMLRRTTAESGFTMLSDASNDFERDSQRLASEEPKIQSVVAGASDTCIENNHQREDRPD